MFLEEGIKKNLISLGVTGEMAFSVPPKPEMGDLAFACFGLAKEKGQNPAEVAKELAERINQDKIDLIAEAKAFGPYVNFYFSPSGLAKAVITNIQKDKKCGTNSIGNNQRIMIEFSQPNTHKEFHVGHLRNVCIGSTLVNLHRIVGYKVIAANYIGDIGAHVAKCLWGMEKFHKGEKVPENRARWLGSIYSESSQKAGDDVEAKQEIADIQRLLESGDKKWIKLWKKTKKWSLEGFVRIYKELEVKFDKVFYESEVEKQGKKMVSDILQSGVAQKGEGGAVIVDLKDYGLDTFLVLKSDGSSLYSTKDLALARKKFSDFKIASSLYVVDSRQSLYFKQLFKTLELMGFSEQMKHIPYEFVTLPEGAMSSRSGNVILYEDLRDQVKNKIIAEIRSRHSDWSESKINKSAQIMTMAVLKFTMLQHEASKVITFDIKEAISFDGFSAPYILYVVARINSLFKKAKTKLSKNINYELLNTNAEKRVLFLLASYEDMVEKALKNYNPSVITKYCFDLAQAFNDFYNNCPILSEDKRLMQARLALCAAVKKVLTDGLDILTIKTVEEM